MTQSTYEVCRLALRVRRIEPPSIIQINALTFALCWCFNRAIWIAHWALTVMTETLETERIVPEFIVKWQFSATDV